MNAWVIKPRKRIISRRALIAILVAAALLISGCTAYVYRNEIRGFVEDVYESFIKVSYVDDRQENDLFIEEYYSLTYMPEGYELVDEEVRHLCVKYSWESEEGNTISFEQRPIDGANIYLDVETGDTETMEYETYTIYYRNLNYSHHYVWNDGKYIITVDSGLYLSEDELKKIFDGIVIIE